MKEYAHNSSVTWLASRLDKFVNTRNDTAHTASVWGFVHRESAERIDKPLRAIHEEILKAKALVEAMTPGDAAQL